MGANVHMLVTGDEAGPTPASFALWGVDLGREVEKRPAGWEEQLDFGSVVCAGLRGPAAMWYIENSGIKIVVDTGIDTGEDARLDARKVLEKYAFALWTDYRPEWTVEAQLARVATHPEDIDVVINTHFHFDHIGNNTRFPNATFIAQRCEYSLALNPPPWAPFYYPEFAFNVLEIRDRLELIDGDMKVTDGVVVHRMGGHSPGSQVVVVETDAGRVCIAGDNVPYYPNIDLNWPPGTFFNLDEVMQGYAWMRQNADIILPQHDWGFFDRYPDGSVG
jgi:glyoxylase-like metal-dependent hydrolase (beta-lactamase superfamily II)